MREVRPIVFSVLISSFPGFVKFSDSTSVMFPVLLVLAGAALTAVATSIDEGTFASSDILTTDVAIIGGGASGTYAAVRLREDLNTSVLLIETNDHLVCTFLPYGS